MSQDDILDAISMLSKNVELCGCCFVRIERSMPAYDMRFSATQREKKQREDREN